MVSLTLMQRGASTSAHSSLGSGECYFNFGHKFQVLPKCQSYYEANGWCPVSQIDPS